MPPTRQSSYTTYLLASAVILCLSFGLALGSLVQKAPTFDEQGFIVRGLAYLRHEEGGSRRIRVGHPAGLNSLSAALLVNDSSVKLPIEDESWLESSFHRPAELFLWEIGNDVEYIMFLARLPSVFLGLLLAAVGSRWAADLLRGSRGRWPDSHISHRQTAVMAGGLMTLLLLALDPNILAHSRLATTDLGLAATATLAGYLLWRYLKKPSWTAVLLAGAGMGLLQNTKFTALLFVPLFGLVVLIWLVGVWRRGLRRPMPSISVAILQILVVYPVAALLTLWVTSGFDYGVLPAELPVVAQLGGRTLPLANYLEQLLDIGGRLQVSTPAFLLGQYSDVGWWYYFPVTFFAKTPLPVLILLGWSAFRVIKSLIFNPRVHDFGLLLDLSILLVPALGYFAFALTTDINLGYRHLLPVLPFLYVFVGATLGPIFGESAARVRPGVSRAAVAVLAGWLALAVVWIYPDFLTTFNLLAGGATGGWNIVVDSNIDWGQDLNRLPQWMDENGLDQVWLSYFGEARPEYYDVNYRGLDSFPPRLMNPNARPLYPSDPRPGTYVISATNLQGVQFADHDQFSVFRDMEPVERLGNSLFIYEVEATGRPSSLVLSGVQLDEIDTADYAHFETNDVRPRWVDGRTAMIIPGGGEPFWIVSSMERPIDRRFMARAGLSPKTQATSGPYLLEQVDPSLPENVEPLAILSSEQSAVRLDYVDLVESVEGQLVLVSRWKMEGSPNPIKLFVHVLDDKGDIVAQWDGLDVAWEGWQEGDTLLQTHTITTSSESLPDGFRVVIGVYDPSSGMRWQSTSGQEFVELNLESSK